MGEAGDRAGPCGDRPIAEFLYGEDERVLLKALAKGERPPFPDDAWARIVMDFAVVYNRESASVINLFGMPNKETIGLKTIKRITDKGFGFIEDGTGTDMFFHSSCVDGTHFNDLREGQEVTYTVGQGPKGPRAENVRVGSE